MPSDDTPLVVKISYELPTTGIKRRVIALREKDHEKGPGSQVETIHDAPELRDYHC